MKSIKDIEENRRSYHANVAINSVHRASLLVPQLPNCFASISFLNHFKIKRGYENVACRVTSVDANGAKLDCHLYKIDQERVYKIDLISNSERPAQTHIIEFFAADNLFIPFPAVMINYLGDEFCNMVHAYNRVLNDVFEDEVINRNKAAEASLDVKLDPNTDTFVLFCSGQEPVDGELSLELSSGSEFYMKKIPIKVPRFGSKTIKLREIVKQDLDGGILKITPPHQSMFYGRIFSGRITENGSFSANHSFYDSSNTAEYWEDSRPSTRLYPFNHAFKNTVRIYPIMSPSEIVFSVDFFGQFGQKLGSSEIGELKSPSSDFLDVDVGSAANLKNLSQDEIVAFQIRAQPAQGMTPTRINHQLVYGMTGLECSLNVSLCNPNIFAPKGKKYFSWGQIPICEDFDTFLHVLPQLPVEETYEFTVKFYSDRGLVFAENLSMNGGQCYTLANEELIKRFGHDLGREAFGSHWYTVETSYTAISAFTICAHRASGHATGEHSF